MPQIHEKNKKVSLLETNPTNQLFNVHGDKDELTCKFCLKSFRHRHTLVVHERRIHAGETLDNPSENTIKNARNLEPLMDQKNSKDQTEKKSKCNLNDDLNHHFHSVHEGKKSAKKVEKLKEKVKEEQFQPENSDGKELMIEDSKADLKHGEEFRTELNNSVRKIWTPI